MLSEDNLPSFVQYVRVCAVYLRDPMRAAWRDHPISGPVTRIVTIMAMTSPAYRIFQQTYTMLRSHLWLWVVPTIVLTAISIVYAAIRPTQWKAAQALVVRDEAIGNFRPQARFDSTESLKAFQETVLEIARSRVVVSEVLKTLGPPPKHPAGQPWPSDDAIEQLQEQIAVSAPKGSEFGTTEVIYLSVIGPTRQEALARTAAVCDQLERRLAELRNAKSASVLVELENNLDLAMADLERATARLEAMESEVGADLAELRLLNQSGGGESNLRSTLNQVKAELRQIRSRYERNQQLRELLQAAQQDPDALIAAPQQLLDAQPLLRRWKDGLADAQLRTAELRGRMSDAHPQVVAAREAEQQVRENILAESRASLQALAADMQVTQQQIELLEEQSQQLQSRLDRLATLRARYNNSLDDVQQRTEIVNQAKRELADARAAHAASQSVSLLTRFHSPVADDRPLGPGRLTIIGAGTMAGLLTGIGLVLLVIPSDPRRSRRWSDWLPFGRRATDRLAAAEPASVIGGRRASDPKPPATTEEAGPTPERRRGPGRRATDRREGTR